MDVSAMLGVTGPFFRFVGEVVEELTRLDISQIDIELLHLKKSELAEQLERAKAKLASEADLEKKNQLADLEQRGLGCSSLRSSIQLGVDRKASDDLAQMLREYNRATEKIALLERKLSAPKKRMGFRFLRWVFRC